MSSYPTDFQGSVVDALREAIEGQIPNSRAEVRGSGGHFTIEVTSPGFAGKSMLESQRMVYGAIAHLMKGETEPPRFLWRPNYLSPTTFAGLCKER